MFRKNSGFTLIELLVVIAIIGVLSSVVLASLNTARKKARDAKRIAEIRQIDMALELYFDEHGHYPDSTSNPSLGNGWYHIGNGGNIDSILKDYMSSVPADPINDGSGFYYFYDTVHNCKPNSPYPAVLMVRNLEVSEPKLSNCAEVCNGTRDGYGYCIRYDGQYTAN